MSDSIRDETELLGACGYDGTRGENTRAAHSPLRGAEGYTPTTRGDMTHGGEPSDGSLNSDRGVFKQISNEPSGLSKSDRAILNQVANGKKICNYFVCVSIFRLRVADMKGRT